MKHYKRVEGVVIKTSPYRDEDALLTLFTCEAGIQKFILFGSSSAQKKSIRQCDLLSKLEIVYRETKTDLNWCQDITHLDSHLSLRQDLKFLKAGCTLISLIAQTQHPGEASPDLYHLFTLFLQKIPQVSDQDLLILCFLAKLLKHDGVLTECLFCATCSKPLLDKIFVSQELVFCEEHRSNLFEEIDQEEWSLFWYLGALRSFQLLNTLEVPEISKLRIRQFVNRLYSIDV